MLRKEHGQLVLRVLPATGLEDRVCGERPVTGARVRCVTYAYPGAKMEATSPVMFFGTEVPCSDVGRTIYSGRVAMSLSQRALASRMASLVTEEESSQVRGMRWLK